MGKPTMWFPNRSNTNQAVQSQEQARSLQFRIWEEEEVYYLCSKNKGADQFCGYREADLRFCFCLCKLLVSSGGGSNVKKMINASIKTHDSKLSVIILQVKFDETRECF